MKRNITEELKIWKRSGTNVPLLIYGPRGTGKTYTTLEFAQSEYDRYIYVNFESDFRACTFFKNTDKEIFESINVYFGLDEIDTGKFIVIFDEIEACPAVCNLFSLSKTAANINIICISSFIPAYYKQFFKCLRMSQMTFDEYLTGIGKEWYREVAEGHFVKKKPVPGIVHEELLELYYDYLKTGGMPEVINEFIYSDSMMNVEEKQRLILNSVLNDIGKYGDPGFYEYNIEGLERGDSKKMQEIIDVIPKHAGMDKQKFTFNFIRRGVTYNMYSCAVNQLIENGVIYKSYRLEDDSFRLTLFDIGLLSFCLRRSGIYEEDALFEKLVRSSMISEMSKSCKVFFWESKYSAKVDCIFETEDGFVPIEVNIASHRKSKSISIFCENVKMAYVVFVGEHNYNIRENMVEMPLYFVHFLPSR